MIEPNRNGEVWVFAEQEDGNLSEVSLELCAKAREMADRLKVKMGAVLPGLGVRDLSHRLIAHGVDRVYHVDHPQLEHYRTLPYARVVCELIAKHKPQIVLYGATALGRDLAPRVASEMKAGLTADCTDLDIGDYTDPKSKQTFKDLLLQIRPAFGGNIIATIVNPERWPQMATVREGVMRLVDGDPKRTGDILAEQVQFDGVATAMKIVERLADFFYERAPTRDGDKKYAKPHRPAQFRLRLKNRGHNIRIQSRATSNFLSVRRRRAACRQKLQNDFVGCAARKRFQALNHIGLETAMPRC